MREIKFRAWDKKRKAMVYVLNMTFLFEDINGILIKGYDNNEINHEIFPEDLDLMQYTGLKDKNGKEIYEGDIVKEGGRLSKVRFSKSYARFELEVPTGRAGLYGFYGEVIGNLQEHPQLLEGETQ